MKNIIENGRRVTLLGSCIYPRGNIGRVLQVSAKEQFAPIAKPAKRHYGDVQKVEKPFATLVVFTTNFTG